MELPPANPVNHREGLRIVESGKYFMHIRFERNLPDQGQVFLSDDEIRTAGWAIGKSTHLRILTLSRGTFNEQNGGVGTEETIQNFQLISEGFCQNRSIQTFALEYFDELTVEIFDFLATFLAQNKKLQCMRIILCSMASAGMRSLAAALMIRGVPLDELNLMASTNHDDFAEDLFISLQENPALTPKKLVLYHVRNVCGAIATLLQDPRCTMEVLDILEFRDRAIDATSVVQILANALAKNTSLKEFHLNGISKTPSRLRALYQSICNPASISATCKSNHTLQILNYRGLEYLDLEGDFNDPSCSYLSQYLVWNRIENKEFVARQKVFAQHYVRDFSMTTFERMPSDLLVRYLNFIDSTEVDYLLPEMRARYDTACRSIILHLLIQRDAGMPRRRKHG